MSGPPLDGRPWWNHLGWMAALLLAASLQAIVAWRSPLVARDGIDFIRYAQNLQRSGCSVFRVQDQHPGYPVMILGGAAVMRPWIPTDTLMWIAAARLPSMLAGLGCVIVVWLLTRRLFDAWAANLAALVFAALPLFRQNAADALSDSPHLFCYLTAAWLACEALSRSSWLLWAATGAASGAAYWIRPEGLAPAVVAGGLLLALYVVRSERSLRRTAACAAALVAAALLVALPYPLISGKLTSKQNPYAQQDPRAPYLINEAEAESLTAATAAGSAPATFAGDTPSAPATQDGREVGPRISAGFLLKTLGKALYEFGHELVHGFRYYFLIFYLLGYFELRKRAIDGRMLAYLYGLATLHFMLLMGVFFMSGYISHRHIMPLAALAMPWIGLGIVYAGDRLRNLCLPRFQARTVGAGVAVVACAIVLPRSTRELHRVFLPARDVATWVEEHTEPDDRLLTNSKYVSYFSCRPTIALIDRMPTIQDALDAAGGDAGYQVAVLDLAEDGFRMSWLDELRQVSHPLFELDTIVAGRGHARVVVLESDSASLAKTPSSGAHAISR